VGPEWRMVEPKLVLTVIANRSQETPPRSPRTVSAAARGLDDMVITALATRREGRRNSNRELVFEDQYCHPFKIETADGPCALGLSKTRIGTGIEIQMVPRKWRHLANSLGRRTNQQVTIELAIGHLKSEDRRVWE
jgi:hypothetical protein